MLLGLCERINRNCAGFARVRDQVQCGADDVADVCTNDISRLELGQLSRQLSRQFVSASGDDVSVWRAALAVAVVLACSELRMGSVLQLR